ncbi:hypothetical protein ACFL6I_22540 [candidate division KSB1 bacterium]
MVNFYTIVKYESLMLFRTWKFWILALVGMFFPIITNIGLILMQKFGGGGPGWGGLEGSAPFMLFYFYNIIQTVIVIFLTSDFREKDHKAHVHEVMCSRSMTNLEYIAGKYFGIVVPLILLTSTIVLILSVVNFLANGYWAIGHYVFNFLILNLPGLLFITAFIIFMSSLLRNTALVFVAVLAYTAATIYFVTMHSFSLNNMWLFLDYLGYFLPLFPSDMVGVLDIAGIAYQRIFYVCLGCFFLGLTVVLFYPRLHQSKFWANFTILGSLLCLTVSVKIFYDGWTEEKVRNEIVTVALEEKFTDFDPDAWRVQYYDMEYTFFQGDVPIKAAVRVDLERRNEDSRSSVPFVLNPGLVVSDVKDRRGQELSFTRHGLDLIVELEELPEAGEAVPLTISFTGTIDNRALFLTRAENDIGELRRDMPTMMSEPALIHEDFSFLLPQSLWYPQLYNPYSFSYPDKRPVHFFNGNISIDLPEDLTAVTQGNLASIDSTSSSGRKRFIYSIDIPVKAVSLNAGRYNRYSMDVSGIDFQLYVSRNHDRLMTFFSEIKDDAHEILVDAMRGIHEITGLDYPYPALSYVEVPNPLQWYQDNGLHAELSSQAGVVMISENILMRSYKASFESRVRNNERRRIEKSDQEVKKDIFVEMIIEDMFSDNWWNTNNMPTPIASFWSHRINFTGKNYPTYEYYFDKYLEQLITEELRFYITNTEEERRFGVFEMSSTEEMRITYGIEVDTLYSLIRTVPMDELMPSPENNNYHAVMMFKTGKLNNILRELVTPEQFKMILSSVLEKKSYSDMDLKDFQMVSESVTGRSLDWYFDGWLKGNAFPGFYITAMDTYKLRGGANGVQYLIEMQLKNGEPDPGYVKVMLNTQDDAVTKRTEVMGNQELIFGFLTDEYPEELTIDPIFSQNVSTISAKVRVPDRFDRRDPWDGIRDVKKDNTAVETVIVDDLDGGFSIITTKQQSYFRAHGGDAEWELEEGNDAFGKYRFTYRKKKAGEGKNNASWETALPESGIYEVETYIYKGTSDWERNRFEERTATNFIYLINHGEGTGEVTINWDSVPEGWNSIGRYYFEKEQPASVILSDDADGEVVADAVRFIPVRVLNTPNER